MRIVFMGTPDFAVPSLEALVARGDTVVGVFTQPDKPKGRGKKMAPPPVKVAAQAHGIPVYQPRRIRKDGVEDLRALAPDLCVTAAFGQILSQEILDIPRLGTINVHASLLPRHRGSAPIAWGILQGDSQAGITTMFTDKGIDTGDMLLSSAVDILPGETCGELTERLSHLGAQVLLDTLAALEAGTLTRTPQNEADMTYDPMLTKEMGILDWSRPAQELVQRIHGLNPWPGAVTGSPEGVLKLWRAQAEPDLHGQPGQVLAASPKEGLVIAAGEGAVRVLQLQAPGGKQMAAADYLRGHPAQVGEVWPAAPRP